MRRETDRRKYYNLGRAGDIMGGLVLGDDLDDLSIPMTLAGEPR